jgi:hypothetical protein
VLPGHSNAVREHDLKTWPPFYEHVAAGLKRFELRPDDRDFEVGDWLHLREWDPERETYTGRHTLRMVTYVVRGGQFGIEPGYAVLGLGMTRSILEADDARGSPAPRAGNQRGAHAGRHNLERPARGSTTDWVAPRH